MEKIKIAFFDLDGTVIDSLEHTIPQANIDAINSLQKNGVKCFVCTGRSYNLLQAVQDLHKIAWDGYICSNGACVYDEKATLLNVEYFSNQQVHAIINKCRNEDMTFTIVTLDNLIAPHGIDKYMVESHQFFNEPLPQYIKPYQDEQVIMLLAFNDMRYDFASFNEISGVQAFPNHSTYCDLVLKHVSKAFGMQKICDILSINQNETIAFGDGGNDLEMLKYAHIGVAMGNACDELKKIATYISSDVDKDGIAQALKHFELI